KSDSEKAQLLAYELFLKDAGSLSSREVSAVQQLDPLLADGFLLAAELEADPGARKSLVEKAIRNGKLDYEHDMEIPWLYIANRPYLRSLFLLGIHYWEQKEFEKAFTEFQRLLQLNPGDHQGARY